jgi:hypothetical protein
MTSEPLIIESSLAEVAYGILSGIVKRVSRPLQGSFILRTGAGILGNVANLSCLAALSLTGVTALHFIKDVSAFAVQNHSPFCVRDGFEALAPRFARPYGTVLRSGVVLSVETVPEIERKAQALARFKRGDPIIYLTLHSYLIPKLSGVSS